MGGEQLVARLAELRPGLPVVYMSGYAVDREPPPAPAQTPHATFVAKPFTADALLSAVRDVLDRCPPVSR